MCLLRDVTTRDLRCKSMEKPRLELGARPCKGRVFPNTPYPRRIIYMSTINCNYCHVPFERPQSELNRSRRKGRPNYCSRTCTGAARSALPRVEHVPNQTCALCKSPFYKKPSSLIN